MGKGKTSTNLDFDELQKAAGTALSAAGLPVRLLSQSELAALRVELERQAAGTPQAQAAAGPLCEECGDDKRNFCVDCAVGYTLLELQAGVYSLASSNRRRKEMRKTARAILAAAEVQVRGIRSEPEQRALMAEIELALG